MLTESHEFVLKDFAFHTGEVWPELRMHVTLRGHPDGQPVMLLHGTNGSAQTLFTPEWEESLLGPGQVLDARHHRIIIPDALGSGRSSKPSDRLRTQFPKYNYLDMVRAQHRLLTECLSVHHLRLLLGYSMGGMHTWLWAQRYPDMMDIAVPMASLPTEMSGRNWMTRRLIIDSIRHDPDWQQGYYTHQPKGVQRAVVFYGLATNGGNQGLQRLAPTREKADALLDERLNAPFTADANDLLYQWDSSRDYNAVRDLERIAARLLVINSADDERNPPELGVMERELKRVKNARLYLIPASPHTSGHGTTGQARFWKQELERELRDVPAR